MQRGTSLALSRSECVPISSSFASVAMADWSPLDGPGTAGSIAAVSPSSGECASFAAATAEKSVTSRHINQNISSRFYDARVRERHSRVRSRTAVPRLAIKDALKKRLAAAAGAGSRGKRERGWRPASAEICAPRHWRRRLRGPRGGETGR